MRVRTLGWGLAIGFFVAGMVTRGADDPAGRLRFEPYQLKTLDGRQVDCELGRLTVPERHAMPDGKSIELALVRLKSTAARPGAPIVHLVGGPGGAGTTTVRTARFDALDAMRAVGDVIVLDQRGTGMARPNLVCREKWDYPLDRPGSEAAMMAHAIEVCAPIARRLRDEGIDLDAYNTAENADDVDLLRRALAVPKISLWGTSYGTHLGLSILRRHPDSVERAILAGVEGPDHTLKLPSTAQRQLETLDRLVKADAEISRYVPDFLGLVRATLDRVDREPAIVELPNSRGSPFRIAIGKFDLQIVTVEAIGRVHTARMLPALYYAMSQGDYTTVARQVMQFRRQPIGTVMGYMMDCASGASPGRLAQIEREAAQCLLGNAANFPFPGVGAAWRATDLGDGFRAPVESRTPVLLISGSLDSRTPAANAEEVARGLDGARHLLVVGAGHSDDLFCTSPEVRRRMVAFLGGENVSTEPIVLPPIKFALPKDLAAASR